MERRTKGTLAITAGAVVVLAGISFAVVSTTAKSKPQSSSGATNGSYTFSIEMPTENTYLSKHPNIESDPYVKQLEKLTNSNINFHLIQNGASGMDTMFAAGNLPNVIATKSGFGSSNGTGLKQALDAGEFLPLNDLLQKYGQNLLKTIPQAAWQEETYNGKIYGIPQFITIPEQSATIIRMDLLKKTGLPVPKTVAQSLQVLEAFKKLGVPQPYAGRQNFDEMDTYFGAYNVDPTQWGVDASGQPVPKFFNVQGMEDALQTYKTMYDKALITPEFLTQTKTAYYNEIDSGKVGMFEANPSDLINLQHSIQESVPAAQLAVIPSPTGPDGQGGYAYTDSVTRAFMITKQTQDPAKIIQFFNWMMTPEASKFFVYGIEGKDYTMSSDGKIQYDPKTKEQVDAQGFRSWLWMVQDETYGGMTPDYMKSTPEGTQLLSDYSTIISKEGREGIRWNPALTALDQNPDLNINGSIPTLLLDAMGKMVTGQEPISDYPKIVQQWYQEGGKAALTEAATAYQNKNYLAPRKTMEPIPNVPSYVN